MRKAGKGKKCKWNGFVFSFFKEVKHIETQLTHRTPHIILYDQHSYWVTILLLYILLFLCQAVESVCFCPKEEILQQYE